MITTLLIVALIILLLTGGIGWHTGTVPPASPVSLLFIAVVVVLLLALILPGIYPHPIAVPVR